MNPDKRFKLIQDDSSHWYVIPADKNEEWEHWYELEQWDLPEWAIRVDGSPSNVTFTDWKDGDGE